MIAAFIDIFAGMEDCERMKNYCAAKSPSVSRRTLLQSTYVLDKVAVDNQDLYILKWQGPEPLELLSQVVTIRV